MTDHDPIENGHRRDFVRTVALASTSAVVASTAALADDPKKAEVKKAEEPAAPEKPATDPIAAEIEARYQLVLARFGKHKQLDDRALASIKAEIAGMVRRAEALRKLPVGNGDGPFPVFHPYRAPLS